MREKDGCECERERVECESDARGRHMLRWRCNIKSHAGVQTWEKGTCEFRSRMPCYRQKCSRKSYARRQVKGKVTCGVRMEVIMLQRRLGVTGTCSRERYMWTHKVEYKNATRIKTMF
jgi:hypothetical protein